MCVFFYCNTQLLADVHIKNVFLGGEEDMHSLL